MEYRKRVVINIVLLLCGIKLSASAGNNVDLSKLTLQQIYEFIVSTHNNTVNTHDKINWLSEKIDNLKKNYESLNNQYNLALQRNHEQGIKIKEQDSKIKTLEEQINILNTQIKSATDFFLVGKMQSNSNNYLNS